MSGECNISTVIKAAGRNMRCNFGLDRVTNALQTGKLDILTLFDCRPKGLVSGDIVVTDLMVPVSETREVTYSLIYTSCVAIATRFKVEKHGLSQSGRILWVDCLCENEE